MASSTRSQLLGQRTTTAKTTPDGKPVVSKRVDAGMAHRWPPVATSALLIAEPRAATSADADREALRAVNRGLATKQVRDLRELYQSFLFAAIMLLVIEAAIGTRKRQRYPEVSTGPSPAPVVRRPRPPPPPPMFDNPALSAMLPLGTQSLFSVIAAYLGVLAVIPPIAGWWKLALAGCSIAVVVGTAGLIDIALRPQKRGITRAIIGIALGIVGLVILGIRWR